MVDLPSKPAPESVDEVKTDPVAEEDLFYDVPGIVPMEEEIFGPAEPNQIFEVAPDKDISSFDLYADEKTSGSAPEKKQQ